MRKITWLGMILGILIVLSLFLPQHPDVARAAPGTESLWSENNSAPDLTLLNSTNADGSTTGTWANASGKWWAKNFYWWEFVMEDSAVGGGAISSVTLYLKHYQRGWTDDGFSIEIYDGSNWINVWSYPGGSDPPISDITDSWDVKALGINTWTKINAAKVRIIGNGVAAPEDSVDWFVDTVELRIDYTPAIISITVTDGNVAYGTLELSATQNTVLYNETTNPNGMTPADTQTATNNGEVAEKFQIKSSNAIGGTDWTLGSSQGGDTFTHKASADGGNNWSIAMEVAGTYYDLAASVPFDGTQTFDLQIGMPTTITDYEEHTITVTVLATAA